MSIVVIGTIYVDIKGYPSSGFIPTGRNAGTVLEIHGGVGRNIAEDICCLGIRPVFVSLAGTDGMGAEIIDRLKRSGVDTTYIRPSEDGSGIWLAIFDEQGDVYANISRRANLRPVLDILKDNSESIFADADGILFEIDMGREIADYVFEQAHKYGKKIYGVISNINIALEMRDLILKTDCFICNQQEAGIFFGKNFDGFSADDMLNALKSEIPGSGLNQVIITMGSQGSVYADRNGCLGITSARNVNVADTTGAGDAFFAGVATALSYGHDLQEASLLGTSMAAEVISVTENVCRKKIDFLSDKIVDQESPL